jgi:glycosyltransferase 2 family protein
VLIGVAAWKADLRAIFSYLSWNTAVAALLVQPVSLVSLMVAGLRLGVLIQTPRTSSVVSFKAVLLCYGANLLLPGRASEILKAAYLRDQAGVPLATGFSAIFLERVTDVLMLGLLVLVGVGLLTLTVNWTLLMGAAILIAGLMLAPHVQQPMVWLAGRLPWAAPRGFVERFFAHLTTQLKNGRFYRAFALAILVWCLSYLQTAVFLSAAGSIPIGLSGALVVFVAGAAGGAIPALPGGFGTFEAAVVFALKSYGYSIEEALLIAVTLHASQLFVSAVGAAAIIALERLGIVVLIRDIMAAFKQG